MNSKLTISANIAHKVTFASHQNSAPILLDLKIENPSEIAFEGLIVELSAEPGFLTPRTWRIDRLDPGANIHILDRKIDLNAGLLFETAEAMTAEITIRLLREDEVLASTRYPVEVLARNEWGGAAHMPELLAAFVTPNDPAVDQLLKRAAQVLQRAGKPDGLNGYESRSSRRVWEMISALWSAVASLRLTYALPPASFETNGQKIRPPGAVLEGGVATCLDTALMFAAALEQMGLNPIVLLTKGHAFVGCWLIPQEFGTLISDDVVAVRKRIALGELVVFETTLVTNKPPPSFSQAVEEGARQIAPEREQDFILALDLRRARMQRLRPLALQPASTDADDVESEALTVESLEEAPNLPDFDAPVDTPQLTPPRESRPVAAQTPGPHRPESSASRQAERHQPQADLPRYRAAGRPALPGAKDPHQADPRP